jgi:hypothetical protein
MRSKAGARADDSSSTAGITVKHGVTDQGGRSGTPLQDGTGNIDSGPIPAGARRTITARETPKDAGNYKVKLTIWGADDKSKQPDSFPAVTCSVSVDPF